MTTPSNTESSLSPCVRVFLSVDLCGSTRLKNVLNQQRLWARFRGAQAVIEALQKQGDTVTFADADGEQAMLASLEITTVDFDWSTVIETFYQDFHTEVRTRIQEVASEMQSKAEWPALVVEPWKAVGDELIYVFEVRSRRQLHWIVIAFLAALRTIDGAIAKRNRHHGLRLKGSAWVAGFPVRNRQIRLPSFADHNGGLKPSFDYLGPEVDTGFRIGKCTRPGMLCVSMELAELLAEVPTALRPMTGLIVGWEQLKGVWEDKHYPVIWVDMPDGHLQELRAEEIDDWELEESPCSKKWNERKDHPKPNLPVMRPHLERIRSRLADSLGLVDPYIIGDPDVNDDVPRLHREIQGLLQRVTRFQREASRQGVDATAEDVDESTPGQIETIVDRAMTPQDGASGEQE